MMKYMSVGLIMTAGVAISAALANGYSQIVPAEAEAHALPIQSAALQVKRLSKINNSTVEKFNSIERQSGWSNTHKDPNNVSASTNIKTEADQFTSLQDTPQRWLLLTYPQSSGSARHIQLTPQLEIIPVANVDDVSHELLPAVYQFTHGSENAAGLDTTEANIGIAKGYRF